LTTKLAKDTKFRAVLKAQEPREALIFSFVPSLVSLVNLVVE